MNEKEKTLLREITSMFFEIENNIVALNKCSSDDFMELNEKLIKNKNVSSVLFNNLNVVYKIFGKEGTKSILETMVEDFDVFKSHLIEMDRVLAFSANSIGKLMTDLNLITIPLKNFNQNLSSLQLLLANLKLLSTSENRSSDGFNIEESVLIEKVLEKVKNVCPVIEENIFVLKTHLEKFLHDIINLQKNELTDMLSNLELTRNDFSNLVEQLEHGLNQKSKAEKLIEDYKVEIDHLIDVLKKQEEIHSEVEDIHKTHDAILKELVKADFNGFAIQNGSEKLDKLKIPQISDNQISRVLGINEKYQKSVEEISHGMIDISDIVKNLVSCSNGFPLKTPGCNNYNFDGFSNSLLKLLKGYRKYTDEASLINKVVHELAEKFYDVEMIEKAVEQKIVDKIHVGEFLIRPEKELAFNSQKVYKLYSDNHFEKNKMNDKFNEAVDSISGIIKLNTVFSYKNGGLKFFESLLENSKENVNRIAINSGVVEKKQSDIEQLGKQIIDKNSNTLEQFKYYSFFDTTVKKVVLLLEQINSKLTLINKSKVNNTNKSHELIEKEYSLK